MLENRPYRAHQKRSPPGQRLQSLPIRSINTPKMQASSIAENQFQNSRPIPPPNAAPRAMDLVPSFYGQRSNIFDPFSLDIWDPFHGCPYLTLRSLSESLPNFMSETSAFANTRIDWKETPEAHVFKADLPGVKKEEVKVEVEEGRVLQISGERSMEKEEKNDKWHRVERSSGKFLRRFRLPENAKVDQVKATMEDGVLTVTVPKEEINEHEVKSIEISS